MAAASGSTEDEIPMKAAGDREVATEIGAEISREGTNKEDTVEFYVERGREIPSEEGGAQEDTAEDIQPVPPFDEYWKWTADRYVLEKTCMDPELYDYAATFDINKPSTFDGSREGAEKVTPRGNTILHLAASVGDVRRVEHMLCDLCAMVCNNDGNTPLHIAAAAGHLSMVCCLVYHAPKSQKVRNRRGSTPLHVALENHHRQVAKYLASRNISMLHSPNSNQKTPFYMAVEAGDIDLVELMMAKEQERYYRIDVGSEPHDMLDDGSSDSPYDDHHSFASKYSWKDSSILGAAIRGKNKDVQKIIFNNISHITDINSSDEDGMTPFTRAAYLGDIFAIRCLLDISTEGAYKFDENGFNPIHLASRAGHIMIVAEFLKRCPDTKYLLNRNKWNILHMAVWYRRDVMVEYILKKRELGMLLNNKDEFGNTPLHLATQRAYPVTISILTSCKGVDLSIKNDRGFTPMTLALRYLGRKQFRYMRRELTIISLMLAHDPQSFQIKVDKRRPTPVHYYQEDMNMLCDDNKEAEVVLNQAANNLLLVSILVATVTFAAGFTVPGGYSSTGRDEGMAALVQYWSFQVFVICNTIGMYSSITLAVFLLSALTCERSYACTSLGYPLFGLSLVMMLLAFTAGVALIITKLVWLSIFVAVMGSMFLVIILLLLALTISAPDSKNRISRFLLNCNFRLLLLVTRYPDDD